jgi:hypothetical protein
MNLSGVAIPPLHENVVEDLEWTKKQEDVANPELYCFDYILYITK